MAGAGSRPWARVEDLVAFGRAHLPGATSLLDPATTALMQSRVLAHPQSLAKAGQGIGWMLMDDDPTPVICHPGEVRGFAALLVLAPERGIVVAALANDGDGAAAVFGCAGEVLGELGVQMSGPGAGVTPTGPALPQSAVVGRYEAFGAEFELVAADGTGVRLVGTETDLDGEPRPLEMAADPIGGLLYRDRAPDSLFQIIEFTPPVDGTSEHVWVGGRLFRRCGPGREVLRDRSGAGARV